MTSKAKRKGLITLDDKNTILYEVLYERIFDNKVEISELIFNDFDGVQYKLHSDNTSVSRLSFRMHGIEALLACGSQSVLDSIFTGMQAQPDAGFDIAFEFDCANLSDPTQFIGDICKLKHYVIGGPIIRAFEIMRDPDMNANLTMQVMKFQYRPKEYMFVCLSQGKVTIIFMINFTERTDKAYARIFLAQFAAAQREVRDSPPAAYTWERPLELKEEEYHECEDIDGYIAFSFEERHIAEKSRREKAVKQMTGFRNFLHYHIKQTKTRLHMGLTRVIGERNAELARDVSIRPPEKK